MSRSKGRPSSAARPPRRKSSETTRHRSSFGEASKPKATPVRARRPSKPDAGGSSARTTKVVGVSCARPDWSPLKHMH